MTIQDRSPLFKATFDEVLSFRRAGTSIQIVTAEGPLIFEFGGEEQALEASDQWLSQENGPKDPRENHR